MNRGNSTHFAKNSCVALAVKNHEVATKLAKLWIFLCTRQEEPEGPHGRFGVFDNRSRDASVLSILSEKTAEEEHQTRLHPSWTHWEPFLVARRWVRFSKSVPKEGRSQKFARSSWQMSLHTWALYPKRNRRKGSGIYLWKKLVEGCWQSHMVSSLKGGGGWGSEMEDQVKVLRTFYRMLWVFLMVF